MCVARHEHVLVLVALLDELVEEYLHVLGNVLYLVAGEEFQVDEHLVVAAASGMDFLTDVAELARQHQLHLGVDILHVGLYLELPILANLVDVLQLGEEFRKLVLPEHSYRLQHRDMGHRTQYVILGKIEVHLAVAAHREPLYLLIDLEILFPKFMCHLLYNSKFKVHNTKL